MDSWHSRPQADLFQELDARPGGLTRRQAEERLARYEEVVAASRLDSWSPPGGRGCSPG